MKSNVFFFVILIVIGLTVLVCRSMTGESGGRLIGFGPVVEYTETMKFVFRQR